MLVTSVTRLLSNFSLMLLGALTLSIAARAQDVIASNETYISDKRTIAVEKFAVPESGRRPAVIILYGASGLTQDPESMREYGRKLARAGYIAFLPHYFDATGSSTSGEIPVTRDRFERWYKALDDGIAFVQKDPAVDRDRIGLMGMSLGAYLALWDASQNSHVKAVVEYYGSINMFLGPPRRMPPTLILHGAKDEFVPVDEARHVEDLLKAQHARYEIHIYADQGHGFEGAASSDAWERTLAFFKRYLSAP